MSKPKKLTGTKYPKKLKSHTTPVKKKSKPAASTTAAKKSKDATSALTDATYSGYWNDTQLSSPPIPVQQISPDSIIPAVTPPRKTLTFEPSRAVFLPKDKGGGWVKGPRPLYPRELAILNSVFGNELDYKIIKVWEDSPFTFLDSSRGLCNTMHIHKAEINDIDEKLKNGKIIKMKEVNEDILIHEAAHVWQYQVRIGYYYMMEALVQHTYSTLGDLYLMAENAVTGQNNTRKIYNPYKYDYFERYKIPWDLWPPEAQAQYIQVKKKLPGNDLLYPYGIRVFADYMKYIVYKRYLK